MLKNKIILKRNSLEFTMWGKIELFLMIFNLLCGLFKELFIVLLCFLLLISHLMSVHLLKMENRVIYGNFL